MRVLELTQIKEPIFSPFYEKDSNLSAPHTELLPKKHRTLIWPLWICNSKYLAANLMRTVRFQMGMSK